MVRNLCFTAQVIKRTPLDIKNQRESLHCLHVCICLRVFIKLNGLLSGDKEGMQVMSGMSRVQKRKREKKKVEILYHN